MTKRKDPIIGQKVKQIRGLTAEELEVLGWEEAPPFEVATGVELENGTLLVMSRDAEGNGPGELFAFESAGWDGEGFVLHIRPPREQKPC